MLLEVFASVGWSVDSVESVHSPEQVGLEAVVHVADIVARDPAIVRQDSAVD